ncbi:MAG: site-2 protease family protein [Clostridia bacterium]|nr:site-2 protease family protein [Clostridia bacterium]
MIKITTLLYILIALFLFGILVFIHEGGHFLFARLCGVEVKEFSIGMGPQLISRTSKKTKTKYGLRLLPIGGFVSMDGEDEDSENPNAFCNKSVPKRMLIVIAGAVINIIFGFIIMFVLVFSQKTLISNTIGEFNEGAMSQTKLMVNDRIVRVDNTRVHTGNEVVYEIMNKGDEPVDIVVIRNGEKITVEDVIFPNTVESGVALGQCDFKLYRDSESFLNYTKHAFWRSMSTVKMVYDSIFNLITGKYGLQAVSGPVGVTEVVGQAARSSFPTLLYVVSVISINLGVFNLLPFPALDGGRFVFLGIEAVRGKPINKKIESYVNFVGIMILFGFMLLVTFKDVFEIIFR